MTITSIVTRRISFISYLGAAPPVHVLEARLAAQEASERDNTANESQNRLANRTFEVKVEGVDVTIVGGKRVRTGKKGGELRKALHKRRKALN